MSLTLAWILVFSPMLVLSAITLGAWLSHSYDLKQFCIVAWGFLLIVMVSIMFAAGSLAIVNHNTQPVEAK